LARIGKNEDFGHEQNVRAMDWNGSEKKRGGIEMLHEEITDKIIKSFYTVYNILGYGFLEKVYENAMMIELPKYALLVEQQKPVDVLYDRKRVGDYFADIIVNGKIILELKAVESLCEDHYKQVLNYLKATDIEVGLLINFGKTPEFKRAILSNEIRTKNKCIKNQRASA
jgi:GxxExxY protein